MVQLVAFSGFFGLGMYLSLPGARRVKLLARLTIDNPICRG